MDNYNPSDFDHIFGITPEQRTANSNNQKIENKPVSFNIKSDAINSSDFDHIFGITPEQRTEFSNKQKAINEDAPDFIPGVQRGVQNLQASLYGAGALVGKGLKKIGLEETGQSLWDTGIEGYRRNTEEAAQYAPKYSFKDVYTGEAGIGGAIDWAQGTLGELIPSMAEAAVGALIGSAAAPGPGTVAGGLAGRTLLRKSIDQAVKGLVKEGTEKAVVDQVRKQVTAQALKKLGAKVGIGTAVMPLESGGMYGDLLESHGIDAPETALLFGALSTALEFMGGNSKLVDTFIDSLAKGSKELTKKSAKEILMNIPEEALQEGGQELFSILNTVANTDEKLLTADNVERIVESMAAGAVGGGAGSVTNLAMNGRSLNKPSELDKKVENITSGGQENIQKALKEFDSYDIFGRNLLNNQEELNAKAIELGITPEKLSENINNQLIANIELRNRLNIELAKTNQDVQEEVKSLTDEEINNKINELKVQQEERSKRIDELNSQADKLRKSFYKEKDEAVKAVLKDQILNLLTTRNKLVEETKQVDNKIKYKDFSEPKKADEILAERQKFYEDVWKDTSNNDLRPDMTENNAYDSASIFMQQSPEEISQMRKADVDRVLSPLIKESDPVVRQKMYNDLFNRPGRKDAQESAKVFAQQSEAEFNAPLRNNLKDTMSLITKESDPVVRQKLYNQMFLQPGVKNAQESAEVFMQNDKELASTPESPFKNEQQVETVKQVEVPKQVETPTQLTTNINNNQQEISNKNPDLNKEVFDNYAKIFKEAYIAGEMEIPEYMTVLDLIAKKDYISLEKIAKAINKNKGSESDPIYAANESFKAKGKADLSRLIKMLGSQMYKGNLAEVTIKEVVQNSFDAVKASLNTKGAKGITEGQIDITVDPTNRIIAVKDNGQGMSKNVLLNAFLTVAGTDKSGLASGDASGGFGMAKAAFLYGNEWIEVNTVKDGKRYKFKANGDELLSKEINVSTEVAPKNAHGTVIVIKVPESVEVNGEQKYVWFPSNVSEISFFKQPLIHNAIEINLQNNYFDSTELNELANPDSKIWNKENFTPIKTGKNFDLSGFEKNTTVHFDWGDADLYIAKNLNPDKWNIKHNILSAGVFQFNHDFNIAPYEKVPYDIILNIFPKTEAESASYPFNIRREGWKSTIEKDIKSLEKYVKNVALGFEAEQTVEQFKNIKSLPKIDVNDLGTNNVDISEFLTKKKSLTDESSTESKTITKTPKITVSDGQVKTTDETGKDVILIDSNNKDDEKVSESFKSDKEAPKAKDFLIDVGIDDSQPIFHNNTNIDFLDLANQHGYSAETFFAEVGSLMLKVKDALAKKTGYGYENLRDKDKSVFIGTSIDKKYHGVNLVVPFQAVLLNPLAVKSTTLPGLVHGYYDTIVHEFAHVPQRSHNESFVLEQARLKTLLASDGTDLEIRVALGRILKKHQPLLNLLRNEYERSTTKNVAKSINDTKDSDAYASSRYPNEPNGSTENGNGKWIGAFETREQSKRGGGISDRIESVGSDVNFKSTPEQIAKSINPSIKYDGKMDGIPGVVDDLHNFTITLSDGRQPSFSVSGNVTTEKLTEQLNKLKEKFGQNSNFEVRDFTKPEQKISNKEYHESFKHQNNLIQDIKQIARMRVHDIKLLADKSMGSISTRLKNVSPLLSAKIRILDFTTSQKIVEALRIAKPLLEATKQMSKEDKFVWDLARKNADEGKINQIASKYGILQNVESLRKVLNKIRTDAIDVGYDVGFLDEYWPRIIKDQEGFLKATQEISERPVFTEAIKDKAKSLGITVEAFERDYPEVKADIISNLILGRNLGIGGPGNIHNRVFDTIPREFEQYYMNSDAALMQYIYSMTKKIEARKFFGKVPKRIMDLKTSKKNKQTELIKFQELGKASGNANIYQDRIDSLNEDISLIDEKLEAYKYQRDYTENIGTYIDDLRMAGELHKKDEKMVRDILDARFHEYGTHGPLNAYKNLAYIDTMGSPLSAITQIGDLAWAMYVGKVWTPQGFSDTIKNTINATFNKSKITKEDLGIERIAQEFADGSTLSNAVSWVFDKVGLTKIDSIGKEVLINNTLDQYKRQIQSNDGRAKLLKDIKPIFGPQSESVIEDLLSDKPSDNVKMLLYSRLLDFQPVALSEMPEYYLKGGNGRVFYMLKTYTLKQFDVFRKEVWHNLRDGDADQKLEGIKNLTKLMALLTLSNAAADEIKDFLMGKETKFSDHVIENFLTLGGASKYMRMQITREGIGSTLVGQILPPFKFIDSIGKDIGQSYKDYVSGDTMNLIDARTLESIPVVGKLAYWHWGRGSEYKESIDEKEFKEAGKAAKLFKTQLENSKDKRLFLQSNLNAFKQMKLHENYQTQINGITQTINKLEKMEQTTNVVKRIGQLKNKKEEFMKRFSDVSKTLTVQ